MDSNQAQEDLRNMTSIIKTLDIQTREIINDIGDLTSVLSDPIVVTSDVDEIDPVDLTIPDMVNQMKLNQRDDDSLDNILLEHDDFEIPDKYKKDVKVPIEIHPDINKLSQVMDNIHQNIKFLQSSISTEDYSIISSMENINNEVTRILGDVLQQSIAATQELTEINQAITNIDQDPSTDTTTTSESTEIQSFSDLVNRQSESIKETLNNYSESMKELSESTDKIISQIRDSTSTATQESSSDISSQSIESKSREAVSESLQLSDVQQSFQDRISEETERIAQNAVQSTETTDTTKEFLERRSREVIDSAQTTRPNLPGDISSSEFSQESSLNRLDEESTSIENIISNLERITSTVSDYIDNTKQVMRSHHGVDAKEAEEIVTANNVFSEAEEVFSSTRISADTPQESLDNYEKDTIDKILRSVSSLDPGNTFSNFEGERLLRRDVEILVQDFIGKSVRRAGT